MQRTAHSTSTSSNSTSFDHPHDYILNMHGLTAKYHTPEWTAWLKYSKPQQHLPMNAKTADAQENLPQVMRKTMGLLKRSGGRKLLLEA